MDVSTRHPLRVTYCCCQSNGGLQKLARPSRKEELYLLARLLRRSCIATSQLINHRGPKIRWTEPSRPCPFSVRSSSQNLQNIELPSETSVADTHNGGAFAPNEAASEGVFFTSQEVNETIRAGANALEKQETSCQDRAASGNPSEGIPASTSSAKRLSVQNEALISFCDASELPNEGLQLPSHSSQGANSQSDAVPAASQASGRQQNEFSVVRNEVVHTVDMGPSPWFKNIPQRYKLIFTTSLAFVICNMDKVNLSVAIIPMSNQLHWNASTAGLVQSSFFWGYTLSQLPGGWLARWFTGEAVLGAGVFIWSVATAAVPTTASFIPALLLSRLIVGLGEGVSPSAATDLIARNIPASERSRAVAFVFNGLNVGSIIGLVLAPVIIGHFGWESVFYIFSTLGIVWSIDFALSTEWNGPWKNWDIGKKRALEHAQETDVFSVSKPAEQCDNDTTSIREHEKIPWGAFFKSPAVWAMIYTHFCGNWGHYCILAWLPTYFSEELNLDLTNAALVAVLPPLGGMFVSGFAAPMADHLISKGVNATSVRKLCQTIAFLSPTAGMTFTSLVVGLSPWTSVLIITSSLALSSFALGGLYCTHQDISPKYASILLGITNTAGAIPGVLGVYLTGVLLDHTHSWTMALFIPCIFFWITGALVWNIFASSDAQSFAD